MEERTAPGICSALSGLLIWRKCCPKASNLLAAKSSIFRCFAETKASPRRAGHFEPLRILTSAASPPYWTYVSQAPRGGYPQMFVLQQDPRPGRYAHLKSVR